MIDINWKPDKSLEVPIYRQIIIYIKGKIASGEWTIGEKLPTQREMSRLFKVNRSTIVEALEELKADGLIEGNSKAGTVIVNNTWSLLTSEKALDWENYIESGIYKPNLSTIQVINSLEYKKGIIRLGTGELSPELYPRKAMEEVILKASSEIYSLGYERPKGSLELREAVSHYVSNFGIKASPNSILIVSGSLQALQLISMSILGQGSNVLVEKPSYIKSLNVFESSGMKLNGISLDKRGIKPQEIINKKDKNTAFLYTIPTFHNPTGILMDEARRKEILKVCSTERLPIIEDDAYRELWLDEAPPKTLKAMDKSGSVLYIGTASKCLAGGMRIGWVIGPEAVIERLGDVKMQTDYGASSLSQCVFAEWLRSGAHEKYMEELRIKLRYRRQVALEMLDKYFKSLAQWEIPIGGFYIWVKLKAKIDMIKLFHLCCDNNILINPGYIYDFSKNNAIRISYSYAEITELRLGLKKLSELINSML